ncbi:unnamed protein product [Urochloa decumbens]|uniref:Uncharacterized protein n=1 Tax=Urochloa decumbens TaxID=240449 RepID=A0ABC9EWB7_9POAL
MRANGGPKKPVQGPLMTGTSPALHPYEEVCLRQCMQNSARLRELGLEETYFYQNTSATTQDKNKRYRRTREDSESEYDPVQDAAAQRDTSDGTTEVSNKKGCSKNNIASDAPSGVKFHGRNRVYADTEHAIRPKQSKKRSAQHDERTSATDIPVQTPPASDIPVPPPPTSDIHVPSPPASDIHVPPPPTPLEDYGHDNNNMVNDNNNMVNEGPEEPWNRGTIMGHGLQRINRARRGKMPIIIPEGHIRPLTPLIAVKYAIECNIALEAPPAEGEDPKSATEVLAVVLDEKTKKNTFLQNVGIQTAKPRSSLQQVQAQLEVEKLANVDLRAKVGELERKALETEHARLRDKEEMKRQQVEFEARLLRRFGQHLPAD